MATIKTKFDVAHVGNDVIRVWKSLALSSGDILVTGLIEVWAVFIQDPTKWSTPSWAVGSGSTRGQVTFTLTGTTTGRVVVLGR